MKTITQKELGSRISELRKTKGYSQDELAKMLKISRPSLTQIELGNRNVSVIELKKIADNLSISIDKLLSQEFTTEDISFSTSNDLECQEVRVSTPKLKIDKFKDILLYILEKCAGKPNIGETLLYKLLYFSDFNYYEIYEEHLTGAVYRKLPFGPVPQKLDSIIKQMIASKMIMRFKTEYHGYPQTRYIPLVKPNLKSLKASEKDILDKVIEQYSDWSASAISEYSHKDMPWLASKEGEVIDYELAFYREHPYSARNYNEDNDVL
ncbi:type II toxin-antitoxin system antitoxin SocA domain-containing protein [Carboxylicivirga taeanensis]|uniref:type II toxin-antitoxin system antitoxin SocA domain-containing protein n=1 Tax=Carboxylicivirga taeanensis TaxID=1416875 RepID=UPI003F6DBD0F